MDPARRTKWRSIETSKGWIASLHNPLIAAEENAANARLMAAAPDLLNALDELLSETLDIGLASGIELTEREQQAMDHVLAAIKKAHG